VPPKADEPLSNLYVRVRSSLEERVDTLTFELRRQHGIRITKAEFVEVLLSELPLTATEDLVRRVRVFRDMAPPRR
jgi:hypothetical protein